MRTVDRREKAQLDLFDEIIVDNFAGGGGASTGIELAAGRPVTIAINHDPDAILMHKTNHPYTAHYQASVWDIDPREVCQGRPVGLAWFPPDYIIDRDYLGNAYGKSKQVARCGNAVPPPFAEALVRANLPEWCGAEIRTMEELEKVVAV